MALILFVNGVQKSTGGDIKLKAGLEKMDDLFKNFEIENKGIDLVTNVENEEIRYECEFKFVSTYKTYNKREPVFTNQNKNFQGT
eukprot:UN00710